MPNTREKLIELIRKPIAIIPERIGTPHIQFTLPYAEELSDHLIANGVRLEEKQATSDQTSKWIPVTERLPEHFGQFSVTVTEFDGRRYTDSANFDPYRKQWRTSLYCGYGDKVTHWMPLPEPPKGE